MTTKTIGHVLYEAEGGDGWLYPHLDFSARDVYERRAQAVAAVVREKCAQAAWAHYMDECKRKMVPPADFGGWCAASAIRSMK